MSTGKLLVPLMIAGVSFFIGGYYPDDEVKKKLINQGVDQEQKNISAKTCVAQLKGKFRSGSESEWAANPSLGFQDVKFSVPRMDDERVPQNMFSGGYDELLKIFLD